MISVVALISKGAMFLAILYFWKMMNFIAGPCSPGTAARIRYSAAVIIGGGFLVGFVSAFVESPTAKQLMVHGWGIVTAGALVVLAGGIVLSVHEALNVDPKELD